MKGIKKGDKIALIGPNSLEWATAELGIIMAGGVVVHASFSVRDAMEVCEIASIAECKAFVVDPGKVNEYIEMISQLSEYMVENPNVSALILLRTSEHFTSYDDLGGILQLKEESGIDFPTLYPEDEIVMFTTSGSTGKPKMVSKTHFQATNFHFIFTEKTYNDRPFAWTAGSLILSVYLGTPRVFSDSVVATEGHNTIKIWEIIKEEMCTRAILLPYFLADLVVLEENYKNSFKLDTIITSGQLVDSFHTKVVGGFTKTLSIVYGLTEMVPVSETSLIAIANEFQAGDVGKPMPGVEVKIIDGNGNVLRKGEDGELCIRSMLGFEKYYKDTVITDKVLLAGKWFRSGDIAHVNEDNHIVIKGRINDCISRGTRKIWPSNIENIIMKMNGLKDVIVVGVPDKRLYEEICVCYVTSPGHNILPTEVKQYCIENFIEHDAIDGLGEMPKYFHRFHSLPKLGNGKVNKIQLRNDAVQQLKLDDQMYSELLNVTT
jgi:fatty-acyl-CoA synthase